MFTLLGCSQENLIQKFSSPEDQATAKSHIDLLRAGKFDEIEKGLDPTIRTVNSRDTLARMADLIPKQEPISVKVVGAHTFSTSHEKTVNTTFEYDFGDKWLLANVVVRERQGIKMIVGFNVKAMPQSLDSLNRFTLTGKSPLQYSILIAAIAAVLFTFYSLVICVKTKFPKRKWLWVLFILFGFGSLAVNWTTGELAITPLSVQLFSANAMAPLYGLWTVAVSLPIGAIIFLFFKRPRLALASVNGATQSDARQVDTRNSP
ncbi:MAG: hypothetical protein ACK4F4_13410 [Hylemonella sp.]|uniref:hypothetical protein n=1 Tax=Hylemonella sp. TaxID=2066020 RepID=UPI00391B5FDF